MFLEAGDLWNDGGLVFVWHVKLLCLPWAYLEQSLPNVKV